MINTIFNGAFSTKYKENYYLLLTCTDFQQIAFFTVLEPATLKSIQL